MYFFSQSCVLPAESSGRERWSTPVMCKRKRGSATSPSPVDRARNGSKHHLLVDATGIPLAWTLTGGNRHDLTQLIPLLERVPPVRGRVGRPRPGHSVSPPTVATTTTATTANSASSASHRRSPA